MAEIKWLGHACFRVRGRTASVLMDPPGPGHGYDLGRLSADIVTVSQARDRHPGLDSVQPGFRAITGPGEYEINEVFITGIATYHDAEGGKRRGRNTVYLVEIDDLVICHLGDLGQPLNEDQAGRLGSVDVLMVPVGGGPTLDATGAVEVIGQLEPSIVIPMQFRTDRGDHDRDPVDRFLKEIGVPDVVPQDRLTVRQSDLGETMKVVVLTV